MGAHLTPMTRCLVLCGLCLVVAIGGIRGIGAGGQTPRPVSSPDPSADARRAVVNRYCVTCHNQRLKTAGLSLDVIDSHDVAGAAETWEKVVRKLRMGSMPPLGSPRPDQAVLDGTVASLEAELDHAAETHPNPGYVPLIRRLNRTEYQNAIRDLLALDDLPKELDIATLLPADDATGSFDNIAEALTVSSTLLTRYISTARQLARLAVGDPAMPLMVDTYRLSSSLPQDRQLEALPFGTRGGLLIRRYFPLDGDYTFRIELAGGARDPERLELSVDGQRAHLFTIARPDSGNPGTSRLEVLLPVKAGPREIGVTFLARTGALTEEMVPASTRRAGGGVAVGAVSISGPRNPSGAEETPSRQRIFICRPQDAASESTCVKRILSTLVRRAYRRPAVEADLQALEPFYRAGRAEGGFEKGIERALERILVSVSFLCRLEEDSPARAPGATRPVSDLELASRLSFFLWSSIPDDRLLDLASRQQLHDPVVLEQEVRRMLADRRSSALVTNFGAQWLYLRDVATVKPNDRLFRDFDDGLRHDLARETELFLDSVLRENRSVLDLLKADYTFLNERLARHYGIPNIKGSYFRRVTLADENRRGLLGQGSILTLTSYATRTSPVSRGKWILENLFGAPPPPPPPNVPNLTDNGTEGRALTMRERMERHRANPQCAGCHRLMDPLGLSLENFDAVGRWRERGEGGALLDVSGALPDGTPFTGAAGLRRALIARPRPYFMTITEKLTTFALGRRLEYFDMPVVRKIVHNAEATDVTFSSLVLGVVKSTPFQTRNSLP